MVLVVFHAKLIFWVLSFGPNICLIARLIDWWIAQLTVAVIILQGRSCRCPKEPVEMDGFGDFILLPPETISSSLMAACTLWHKSRPASCHAFWTVHLQKPRQIFYGTFPKLLTFTLCTKSDRWSMSERYRHGVQSRCVHPNVIIVNFMTL